MSDYGELKKLAGAIASCTSILALEERGWMRRTTGEKVVEALEEIEELKSKIEGLTKLEAGLREMLHRQNKEINMLKRAVRNG